MPMDDVLSARSIAAASREGFVEQEFYAGRDFRGCDIIRRFDRFPHRNLILGRDMTAQEQEFLDRGGFAR